MEPALMLGGGHTGRNLMSPWEMATQAALEIKNSLDRFDWGETRRKCNDLIRSLNSTEEPFPIGEAKEILFQLRRKRQFQLMEILADALIRNGQNHSQISRQYAQAMIDQGNFSAAMLVLNSILSNDLAPLSEKAEASGLIGRIYKQLYVNAGDPANLRQQENLRQAI